ncbi:hypothetical protein HDE_00187 [Halotydeus destructor]|nr:hypothetical protein HDE_00187 [Halotydeus destructor]
MVGKHISSILKRKQQLNDIKRRFNDVLSPFPLIWLTSVFLQSSGLIIYITDDKDDNENVYRLWIYAAELVCIAAVLGVVILLDNWNKESDRRSLVELDLLNQPARDSNGLQDWIRLRECVTEHVQFHAVIFNIDTSMILGFAGSLVTFTVMFVQLVDKQARCK